MIEQKQSAKKIGITTLYKGNYGSILQCLALQKVVADRTGCEAEAIRFSSRKSSLGRKFFSYWNSSDPWHYFRNTLFKSGSEFKRRSRSILEPYIKSFIKESPVYEQDEIFSRVSEYSAFICGSDQIWSPFRRPNPNYFLQFAPPVKRIAYAPSFGFSAIPQKYWKTYVEYVGEIPHLSCRESAGVKIIKELTNRTARHVVDPTQLLTQDQWEEFISNDCVPDKPYVLCYLLQSDRYIRQRVAEIAKRRDWDVYVIPLNYIDAADRNVRLRYDVNPGQLLGLIKNAKLVCTDSFHGTALSVNFNTPFITFQRYRFPETSSRMIDYLKKINLFDRFFSKTDSVLDDDVAFVDFSSANRILNRWRMESLEFLTQSLAAAGVFSLEKNG